jgi:hypothetical protein
MVSIKEQEQYERIGRLRKPIADSIGRKAANIYVDHNHLRHVFIKHKENLAELGLTPKVFIDLVVNGFNRIYKGAGNSLLLVIWNGKAKVVAIELNFALKKEFYEVKTATIYRKDFFKDENLMWTKK